MPVDAIETAKIAVLVGLLGTALYTDFRYGKIYNKLTIPCMAVGITLNAADGLPGVFQSAVGAGVVLFLFLVFAPAVGIGGGDTKLMMAVGSIIGLSLVVWTMLYSAVVGGVLALVAMARQRALLATTQNMAGNIYLKTLLWAPVELTSGSRGIKFRYSPAIALGTLLTFFLKVW